MALTLSEIQAITTDDWMPGAQNQWAMGNVLMFKLLGKVQKIGSCEKIRQVLEYATSNGGAMGATTQFNTTKKKILNAARYPWAYFWAGNTIDIEDETQASGGDADVDIVLTKLDNIQRTIRDIMGTSMWTAYATTQTTYGEETKPFMGVEDLMAQTDGTPTFGSIAMADLGSYTDGTGTSRYIWRTYSNTNSLTMNYETMQTLRRGCKVGSGNGEKPDLYVTTETLKDAFENSLQAAQRFTDSDLAKAGFDNVKVGATGTMTADDKCPANYCNAFNTNRMYLKAHRDFFFTPPVWKQPTGSYAKTTQIIFSGAFVVSERRAFGRMTSLS